MAKVIERLARDEGALVPILGISLTTTQANKAIPHGLKDPAGNGVVPTIIIVQAEDSNGRSIRLGSTAPDATNIYLTNDFAGTGLCRAFVG